MITEIASRRCIHIPKAVCMIKTYARFIFATQIKCMLKVILAKRSMHVLEFVSMNKVCAHRGDACMCVCMNKVYSHVIPAMLCLCVLVCVCMNKPYAHSHGSEAMHVSAYVCA